MEIPTGYGQLTFEYGGNALAYPAVNTLGFVIGTAESPLYCATNGAALWETNVMPLLCDEVELASVLAKWGPTETGPSAEVFPADPGGDNGNPDRANTCYLITKNTEFGGRQGRGRLYLPGVTEDQASDYGTIAPARVSALNDAFDDVLSGMISAGFAPALLHGNSLTPYAITSFSASGVTATQRRRMRR